MGCRSETLGRSSWVAWYGLALKLWSEPRQSCYRSCMRRSWWAILGALAATACNATSSKSTGGQGNEGLSTTGEQSSGTATTTAVPSAVAPAMIAEQPAVARGVQTVVVRISEVGRVGNHHAGQARGPKRGVVGAT
jgi:hypothetical protein